MNGRVPAWLYLSFVLTALSAGYSLSQRYRVESENKAVGIVVDVDTIQTLAASQGVSISEALSKLKTQGVNGIVLPEETIGDIVTGGRAIVAPATVRLVTEDPQLRARVARGLTQRFGLFIAPGDATLAIGSLDPTLARSTSIGLDPVIAGEAQAQGFFIVCRLGNPTGATDAYVKDSINWAAEVGATFFLPQGDQVLGRRDALPTLIEALRQKMFYATPEFTKLGGDANVVSEAPEITIRLHAAQNAELDRLGMAEAVERYGKAAAERNQRLLLVRPLTNASPKPLDSFGEFVGKIRRQVEKEGMTVATPHPFRDSGVPIFTWVLLVASTMPAMYWLSAFLPKWRNHVFPVLLVLGISVGATIPAGRGIYALLCAVAYPVIAFILCERLRDERPSMLAVLTAFVRTTAISLAGGLCVGGLLNGLSFFVKADAFAGVKVAHFLPIAIIGLYFFGRGTDLKAALKSQIFWSQAAIGVLLLVGFAFMAARTGNDNPAGVSGLELKIRGLLDQFLYVRPRTKEFLIGHPAMIIAIGLSMSRRVNAGWVAIAMMVGAIGQTSVVNTMCHLHTPVTVSLARIGVGLLVGGILGAMGWGVLNRFWVQRT